MFSPYMAYGDISCDTVYEEDSGPTVTYDITILNKVYGNTLPNPGEIKVVRISFWTFLMFDAQMTSEKTNK